MLVLIHDGRAVAMSHQNRTRTNPYLAIHSWKQSVILGKVCEHVLGEENFLTIGFEDLRSKPLDEIEKIIEFLGGDTSREILNSICEASNLKKQEQGGFFRKGVSGDWTNHLTSKNRKDFSRITGNTLIRFGYEQDSSWTLQTNNEKQIDDRSQ